MPVAGFNPEQVHIVTTACLQWCLVVTMAHLKQVLKSLCLIVDQGARQTLHNEPVFTVLNDGNVGGLSADVQQVIALLIVDLEIADTHSAGGQQMLL